MDIDEMEEGQLVYVKKVLGIDWRHGGGMEEGTIGKIDNISNPLAIRVKSTNFGYPHEVSFAFDPDEVHPIEPGLKIWDEKYEEKGIIKRMVSSDENYPYRIYWPESKAAEYSAEPESYLTENCRVIVDEKEVRKETATEAVLKQARKERAEKIREQAEISARQCGRTFSPFIFRNGLESSIKKDPEEIEDNSFRRLIRKIKRNIKKLKGEKQMLNIEGTFKIEEVDDGFICTVEADGVKKTCADNGDQEYLLQYTFGKVKREINTKERTEKQIEMLQEELEELREKKGE
ncbi:MAG: hypothetical protein ACOC4Y_02280 [bacterium]